MKIIYKEGEGEIEEKKSRFIAHVYPVQSEEQAVFNDLFMRRKKVTQKALRDYIKPLVWAR